MNRNARLPRLRPATATASLLLAALAAACSHPATHHVAVQSSGPSATPGHLTVTTGDIDLAITHATAHLDSSGDGSLTMTLHNGGSAPEHLDMVATANGGRGRLTGGPGTGDGSMASAGILIRAGSTVTFGGNGPQVHFTALHTASHTLPLVLEFGIAGLVHLDAVVANP